MLSRRKLLVTAAAGSTVSRASAQPARPVVKIGVLNDQSGGFRDVTGPGSIACVQQAVREFGPTGFDVQVVAADHQNKPDVGAAIARQWFDRDGVDVIMDVPVSSVALAVNSVARDKNKLYINNGAGTGDLTGAQCTPVTIHWAYNTYMLARSTVPQITRLGGNKWFFLTADFVFGHQLAQDAARFVTESGGVVVGEQRYPFPSTVDFSSLLLTAQASGANVIGLATPSVDTASCLKQAHEFGLTRTMKMAALLLPLNDVKAIGPEVGAGLYVNATFYWDQNEGTRRFTQAVQGLMPSREPPNFIQASCYASALHYPKAVAAVGADRAGDGAPVCAQMKAMPTEDDAFGRNRIRSNGLCELPTYLYQVKDPAESRGPWDLQKLVATTPGEQAWKPLAAEGCAIAPVR